MKLIGAGLMRTATTTQMFALEQLGVSPCYHMRDLLSDLERGLPLWERAWEGDADWEQIFGDAQSTVDWPSARFYSELMDYYPEAKVLLSVRSGRGLGAQHARDRVGDLPRRLGDPSRQPRARGAWTRCGGATWR